MSYTIKGFLRGFLCRECWEPLTGMTVRVYRATGTQAARDASAREKATYRLLDDDEVEQRGMLLGTGRIGDDGRYEVVFADDADYHGGEDDQDDAGYVQIDVYAETVPGQEEAGASSSPVQFSITTLLPRWEQRESGFEAAFDHEISAKFWCTVRARFGVWVICGRVTHCETEKPLTGLRVLAFDTDWIQDDPLGAATTDANGRYRIYYTRQTFRRTPISWISWEAYEGPDVYFHVQTAGGTPLLVENRSRGRDNDRENVGPCFCEDLCVIVDPGEVPDPQPSAEPQFDHVGQYALPQVIAPGELKIDTDGFAGDVDPLAFSRNIDLIGTLPNGGATPKEYRFRFAEFDSTTSTYGPLQPVEAHMIAPTRIGGLQYYTPVGSSFQLVSESYWLNHPTATNNVSVNPGGWIEVPTENNLGNPAGPAGTGKFVRNSGRLLTLETAEIVNQFVDLVAPTVHEAGNGLAASEKSPIHTYKLVFEAQDVGGGNSRTDELAKIVITNTSYKQRRHPSWNVNEPTLPAVVMLDIAELQGTGSGCKKIDAQLHALYTVYNPHLKSASVSFEGNPPLPAAHTPTVSGGEAISPAGGHAFNTSSLVECAFIVWLSATLNVTSGYGRPSWASLNDRIAICVSH